MIFWNTQSVFIRVPKTASTAILYSLLDCSEKCSGNEFNKVFDALKPEFLDLKSHDDPNHVTYETFKNTVSPENMDLIDSYFKFAFVRNPFDRAVSIFKYIAKIDSSAQISNFKNFAKYNFTKKEYNGIWLADQASQVVDCDFIGRFENLQADFDLVCQKIGIKRNPLLVKNRTSHKHYSEYYDEETIEIVARKYHADIIRFGYKFEKPA